MSVISHDTCVQTPESTVSNPMRSRRKMPFLIGTALTATTAAVFLSGCSSNTETSGAASNSNPRTASLSVNNGQPGPAPTYAKPGPDTLLPNSHHTETQQFGAPTFTDIQYATGYGPKMAAGTKVDVDCLAHGPAAAAPSTKGLWYHIVKTISDPAPDDPNFAGYYAAANTFENGDTSGPLSSQPIVDPNVPNCPGSQ